MKRAVIIHGTNGAPEENWHPWLKQKLVPTFRHSWISPREETWATYGLSSLGGVFAIAALSSYNWINLPYAIYIVLANAALVFIIVYRMRKQAA